MRYAMPLTLGSLKIRIRIASPILPRQLLRKEKYTNNNSVINGYMLLSFSSKDKETAIKYMEIACGLELERKNYYLAAYKRVNLGHLYIKTNQPTKTKEQLHIAQEYAKNLDPTSQGYREVMSFIYKVMGKFYSNQGKLDSTTLYFE